MANVVMLLQEYYPSDTRVRKEALALKEINCHIDIICLRGPGQLEHERESNVIIHRVNLTKKRATKFRYAFEYLLFFFQCYWKLKKLVKNKKIDIVHVHTLPDFLVFAAYPAKKKGARVILDMHEIMPEFFISKYKISPTSLLVKVLKFIEQKSLSFADVVLTINTPLKNIFESRADLKKEIVIIMNTVDDDVMPLKERKQTDKFVAIYHGTVTQIYNLDFVVKAIAKIIHLIPDFQFHVYGNGPKLHELRSLIKEYILEKHVFVHGKVDHHLIPDILSKSQLGILPIKKDIMTELSFSNKLAEYVHNKVPVLSSNLSGVMSYFPYDSVYYFQDNDTDDFNKQLLHIYNHPEEAREYAERAYDNSQLFSWSVMKKRLQTVYWEILQ